MNTKTRTTNIRARIKYFILGNSLLRHTGLSILNSRRITTSRPYNYFYAKQIQRVAKNYRAKPQHVLIELTNTCNLRCTFCPHSDMQRPIGFMEDSLYKKVIDQCVLLGIKNICLSGLGEPTIHKSLETCIRYAKDQGIPVVSLVTNGTLLSPNTVAGLLRSGLDILRVSVDAANSETYSRLKPPGKLEAVRDGLTIMMNRRLDAGSKAPLVQAKFMVEGNNADELHKFKQEWKNLADELLTTFPHNWGGTVYVQATDKLNSSGPCATPFRQMVVFWDGRVPLCCLDAEGEVMLGDISTSLIREIWQGDKIESIRKVHLEGDPSTLPLCGSCSFRDPWWGY